MKFGFSPVILRVSALALPLLTISACQSTPQKTVATAPSPAAYQPLQEGDRWSYQFRSFFGGRSPQFRVKTQAAQGTEEGAWRLLDEKGDYYLYSCNEKELRLHGEREEGKIHTFNPPFVYLREGMEQDRVYETQNKSSEGKDIRCEARYLGTFEVKTPAGVFADCIRADFRYYLPTGNSFWIETTLARGVGTVTKRFALYSPEGKVLARFDQELLSAKVGGQALAGRSVELPTFWRENSALAEILKLSHSANVIQLNGISWQGAELAFATPAIVALPEIQESFPYRSTVKDANGKTVDVVSRWTTLENSPSLEIRVETAEKEFTFAAAVEKDRGIVSMDVLSWDRQKKLPESLLRWPKEESVATTPASANLGSTRSASTMDALGRALLRNAHESRLVWPASFEGFKANAHLEVVPNQEAARVSEGTVDLKIGSAPKIEGFSGEDAKWLQAELVSILSHRRHAAESVGKEPPGRFVWKSGGLEDSAELELEGDPMGSGWTINKGRVAKVNRKEIGGRFEIEVRETWDDEQGRYLPTRYKVSHFDKEEALRGWEEYRDEYDWSSGVPMLRLREIVRFSADGTKQETRRLTLSGFVPLSVQNQDSKEGA